MKCCINCFEDVELKNIIEHLKEKGDCDFCHSHNVYVYDIEKDNKIGELLTEILYIYTLEDTLPREFPINKLEKLEDILMNEWHIFNLDKASMIKLVKELCKKSYTRIDDVFEQKVGFKELHLKHLKHIGLYLENNAILKTNTWEDFVENIKTKNRFHTDFFNENELEKILSYTVKTLKKGEVFYRARISKDKKGYNITEMGAPPANLASAGRANAEGISCLYLASDEKTTFYEIRAIAYDYVCVGRFELNKDIEIIDLSSLDKISPFISELECMEYAINVDILNKIAYDISRPMRRHDSKLDYLPTQYISDFIKKKKYAGIMYKSTLSETGYNLAIFDESIFTCIDTKVYEVESLSYDYK